MRLFTGAVMSLSLSAVHAEPLLTSTTGVTITAPELEHYLLRNTPAARVDQALSKPGALEVAVESLYVIKRLAMEAEAAGIVESDYLAWIGDHAMDRFAMTSYLDYASKPDSADNIDREALARDYYRANINDYRVDERIRARHILIKTSDKPLLEAVSLASEALARAREPDADFSALAVELSEGGSADRGGDLGFFSRGDMAPQFEQAALALEIGDVSDLVLTRFGIHIIKLDARETGGFIPFEQVKPRIIAEMDIARLDAEREAVVTKYRLETGGDAVTLNEDIAQQLREKYSR